MVMSPRHPPPPFQRAVKQPESWRKTCLTLALCSLSLISRRAAAQGNELDVVYGRIFSAKDSTPIIGAAIVLRALSTGEEMKTNSREIGFYAFFWMDGGHSYSIRVAATGFAPQETRIVRTQGSKPDMITDFYLRPLSTSSLAPVSILAASRAMALRIGNGLSDRLGMDRSAARSDQLPPDEQGNVNGLVAMMPDISLTSSADGRMGYSALGLAPSQNSVTLNGSSFAGDAVPRDAVGLVRFSKTPFDPSRGGFSGGQITITPLPGSNNSVRTAWLTTNSGGLDAGLSGQGAFTSPTSQRHASGTASGAIIRDKLFYNASAQAGRTSSSVYSLIGSAPSRVSGVGAASDSARSAAEMLRGFFPSMNLRDTHRVAENASFLSRVDLTPFAANAVSVTVAGQHASMVGALASPQATPSHAGIASFSSAFEQAVYSRIAGGASNDLRVSLSQDRSQAKPSSFMPEGRVLSAVGTNREGGFSYLEFGGNSLLPVQRDGHSVEAVNETSWYLAQGRHQPKVYIRLRQSSNDQRTEAGNLGTYTYYSLDDLAANAPSTYERNLQRTFVSASVSALDASVGDLWQPAPFLLVQYGIRFSSARYRASAAAEVEEGGPVTRLQGDAPPASRSFSPRIGFKWSYGSGTLATTDFASRSRGQIRGGIGVFRNDISADRIVTAVSRNGAIGQRLMCVGSAIPPVAWGDPTSYGAVPNESCGVGTLPDSLSGPTRSRTFFSNEYNPETSFRALLGWELTLESGWRVGVELTSSAALHQPSSVDINFSPVPRFGLSDEAGRPVYVPPEAIALTGVPRIQASRLHPELGAITKYTSDLKSHASQGTLTLRTPDAENSHYSVDVGYTLSRVRDKERGFGGDGSTASDLPHPGWARSLAETEHQLIVNGLWKFRERTEVAITSRVRSGSHYTPLVGSDVNGDGESNDRAFVFGAATTDTVLGRSIASLIESSSREVQECLRTQVGRIASQASCTGSWGASFDARVTTTPETWLGRRATFTLSILGLSILADRMLHGSHAQRGWGQVGGTDPVLLFVRGFDPLMKRYKYAVNPQFGKISAGAAAFPRYAQITLDIHVLLGALPPGLSGIAQSTGRKQSAENNLTIEALESRRALFDGAADKMLDQVLSLSEQVEADSAQIAALAELQHRYAAVSDSAWRSLEKNGSGVSQEAVQRTERFLDRSITAMAQVIRDILRPDQYRRLPSALRLMFEDPIARRVFARPN
jgi:hypothetical protein